MKPSEIMHQLRELQSIWRQNNFSLSEGQRVEYNNLLRLRRDRVLSLYKNGLVYKGSKASDA